MKMAKKMLAVVMVLTMVAAFSAIAFAANPSATFTVGDYADGKATVSVKFVGAVGLTSGSLNFAYADGKVTKILKKNGADAAAIGDIDNAFSSEFNSTANPAEFGFYFKNNLWDSAAWKEAADELDQTTYINGEAFECAQFVFTAEEGTEITVTGELKIGETVTPVNTSFTIGDGKGGSEEPPVAHTHTMTKVDAKAATCTAAGNTEYYTCSGCGKTFSDAEGKNEITVASTVIAAGHKWDAGKVTKAATCTEAGVKTFTCSVCNETKTEAIAKLAHDWDAGKVTKEATETAAGEKVYTCKLCGATKSETIPAKSTKIILDVGVNNNGIAFVCTCGDKNCKCQNQNCTCKGVKCADDAKAKCGDPACKCFAASAAATKTAATKTAANVKTDGGKKTGDNSVLAIMAGVIAMAGAAFVVTKKRK